MASEDMDQIEQDIVIGKIVAPFGVRGEVKAIVLTEFPERLNTGNEVRAKLAGDERRGLRIDASRPHRTGVVLKLRGVNDKDAAEELRGAELVIDRSEVAELPEGRFYIFDLIGIKVVTDDGRELGVVTEVLQGGSNDVYVTSTGLCIPALKDVVTKIDVAGGMMEIHPVPGLLADE